MLSLHNMVRFSLSVLVYTSTLTVTVIDAVVVENVNACASKHEIGEGKLVVYKRADVTTRNVIKIGFMGITHHVNTSDPFHKTFPVHRIVGDSIAGAITYAIDTINNDTDLLPRHTLELMYVDQNVYRWFSSLGTVGLIEAGVSAIFGPEEYCEQEAYIAGVYDVAMFGYKCYDAKPSNKKYYPTFVRTVSSAKQEMAFVITMVQHFKWRKLSIITDQSFRKEAILLQYLCEEASIKVNHFEEYKGGLHDTHFTKIVEATVRTTRVYVFLGDHHGLIDLLEHMGEFGAVVGEHVVVHISHEPYHHSNFRTFASEQEDLGHEAVTDELKQRARQLLILTQPHLEAKENIRQFYKRVVQYNTQSPFCFGDKRKQIAIPVYAAHLYDSVYIFARALHKLIEAGRTHTGIDMGRDIVSQILGQKYKSIFGYTNMFTANGDLLANYSLMSYFPDDDQFKIVGVFQHVINDGTVLFVEDSHNKVDWVGGKVPPDEPECGYLNHKCVSATPIALIGAVAGGIIALCLAVMFVFACYSHRQYALAIDGLGWKIDDDLIVHDGHTPWCPPTAYELSLDRQTRGSQDMIQNASHQNAQMFALTAHYNNLAVCMRDYGSNMDLGPQGRLQLKGSNILDVLESQENVAYQSQKYTTTGMYKGHIVALKTFDNKSVNLNLEKKKQMKMMRDLRHDNLTAFLGVCITLANFTIITAYCAKGSLQDILVNDQLKLDEVFISSLCKDLIQGLMFIHKSQLVCHGNLKSSNCLVTSRWTLQVTDFGLLDVRATSYRPADEYSYYRNLLWTAPELLRTYHIPGTRAADVYALGVIIHEIFYRMGPFNTWDLNYTQDPKEIVEKVIDNSNPANPHRPDLTGGNVMGYVRKAISICWAENPSKRPTLGTIWKNLKPMRHGMKSNIFDNMMAMMEKYQSDLEMLVEERTMQLVEEKAKTENLLYRMLPRSVADELKKGQRIEPESFHCVTIYFSDICGFTALSATSTPMQVVDLLNDLYTMFDSTIANYDVYKVETIGDAYMVVSGLPLPNGDNHAGEIASMSLGLLLRIGTFRIRHRPAEILKLRVGIHSGPCVAGVVGSTMPRYCLFGDTVNTASRVESSGAPLKVHVSEECTSLLTKLGGYTMEKRGIVEMKGKGMLTTYWLLGEDRTVRQRRMDAAYEESVTSQKDSGGLRAIVRSVQTALAQRHVPVVRPFLHRVNALTAAKAFSPTLSRRLSITDIALNNMADRFVDIQHLAPNERAGNRPTLSTDSVQVKMARLNAHDDSHNVSLHADTDAALLFHRTSDPLSEIEDHETTANFVSRDAKLDIVVEESSVYSNADIRGRDGESSRELEKLQSNVEVKGRVHESSVDPETLQSDEDVNGRDSGRTYSLSVNQFSHQSGVARQLCKPSSEHDSQNN